MCPSFGRPGHQGLLVDNRPAADVDEDTARGNRPEELLRDNARVLRGEGSQLDDNIVLREKRFQVVCALNPVFLEEAVRHARGIGRNGDVKGLQQFRELPVRWRQIRAGPPSAQTGIP
jgi:hypothetical protein